MNLQRKMKVFNQIIAHNYYVHYLFVDLNVKAFNYLKQ